MMYFARFGGHDAVKLIVRREPVDERNDDVAIEKQALPFHGIGDIGQLIIRNAQMPRENLAVARRLIEHDPSDRIAGAFYGIERQRFPR